MDFYIKQDIHLELRHSKFKDVTIFPLSIEEEQNSSIKKNGVTTKAL
jgi:hypothetical protein